MLFGIVILPVSIHYEYPIASLDLHQVRRMPGKDTIAKCVDISAKPFIYLLPIWPKTMNSNPMEIYCLIFTDTSPLQTVYLTLNGSENLNMICPCCQTIQSPASWTSSLTLAHVPPQFCRRYFRKIIGWFFKNLGLDLIATTLCYTASLHWSLNQVHMH